MSASNKKKLRNEQASQKLTERQLAEQKEAKKLKLYTNIFIAIVAVLAVIAVAVGVSQAVSNSGVRERKTVAMTVGDREVSNSELNYFFLDSLNQFYAQNGSYAALFGLDMSKPLDQQVMSGEETTTWADYFLDSAKDSAKSVYTLAAAAKAEGMTLSETDAAAINSNLEMRKLYATMYGYSDAKAYLKAMYGKGATEESYRGYLESSMLADAYYQARSEALTYADSDLRAKEGENPSAYSAYTYNYYYLAASKFLEGGTADAEGTLNYSDEEKNASVLAAEEAAKALISEEITSVDAFDAAIADLSVNADAETPAKSAAYDNAAYSGISETYRQWLTDSARKEGDKTYIANTATGTDESGKEVTTTTGYYVLYFRSVNDNNIPMSSVRHILVGFEGGTADDSGVKVYSAEEKAAAKSEAEEILAQWQTGEATEDSFAALANEKSDDGNGTTGGLYEHIVPSSNYVENFLNWALDSHKAGDTGIVETEYGYHIMYFVGRSQQTYRDFMIESELREADVAQWYTDLLNSVTVTDGNTAFINKSIVMGRQ